MSALLVPLAVCLAGSLGAVARFVVDGEVRRRWPTTFPWPTVGVNVTGSLLLGLVTGLVLAGAGPQDLRAVAGLGFCGGYTTFSTAVLESVRLAQRGAWWAAAGNAAGTLVATTAAAAAGLAAGLALG
ncbi:fluoride efflux transporter FluC [Kineococcus sp. SYSU DK004]|uniref:fluoride efflux transporter FluC n=1 Tax=Kineococcus sp. SYSU DK004 TaxID=3383125 RepID=UPI003D7E70E9